MVTFEGCGEKNGCFDKDDINHYFIDYSKTVTKTAGTKEACGCKVFYGGRVFFLNKSDFDKHGCHIISISNNDQPQDVDVIEEFIKYTGLKRIK